MGMQDQYQDGRYDGIQTDEPNPGYIESPGGWWAPKEEPSELTPTKETHTMAEPTPEEATLAELHSLKQQLDDRILELTNRIKNRKIPAAPGSSAGNMFKVGIKYAEGGPTYQYLIYRAPAAKGWYTTGQGEDGYFPTWRALVEWLRRPQVYWHSALVRLVNGNSTVMDAERPNA